MATSSKGLVLHGLRTQSSKLRGRIRNPIRSGRALAEEFENEVGSEEDGGDTSEGDDGGHWLRVASYRAYASCDLGSIESLAARLKECPNRVRLWDTRCNSAEHDSLGFPASLGSLPPEAARSDEYRALLEVPSLERVLSCGKGSDGSNFYLKLHEQWSADP